MFSLFSAQSCVQIKFKWNYGAGSPCRFKYLCVKCPQHFKLEFLFQSNDLGLKLPSSAVVGVSSAWLISFHTRKLPVLLDNQQKGIF